MASEPGIYNTPFVNVPRTRMDVIEEKLAREEHWHRMADSVLRTLDAKTRELQVGIDPLILGRVTELEKENALLKERLGILERLLTKNPAEIEREV